jgi:hypothetical protein
MRDAKRPAKQDDSKFGPHPDLARMYHNDTVLQFWAEVGGAPQYGSPEKRAQEVLRKVRADEELLEKTKSERACAKKLHTEIRASERQLEKAEGKRRTELHQNTTAKKKLLRDVESKCGEGVFSEYEQRALTLDLVHACWPNGSRPPAELVILLKKALKLTDNHQVGGWMVYFKDEHGHVQDGRGPKRNLTHWLAAADIEGEYITRQAQLKEGRPLNRREFEENIRPMSDRLLEKEMRKRFGSEAPSRRTLRDWRKSDPDSAENREYRAYAYGEGVDPPDGAWLRPEGDEGESPNPGPDTEAPVRAAKK